MDCFFQGDLINFFKFRKVADIILEIKSYQYRYPLEISSEISNFLSTLTFMTEDEWHTWSQKVGQILEELRPSFSLPICQYFLSTCFIFIFLFSHFLQSEPKVPEKVIGELIQKEMDLDGRLSELKKKEEELLSRYLSLSGSATKYHPKATFSSSLLSLLFLSLSLSLSLSPIITIQASRHRGSRSSRTCAPH